MNQPGASLEIVNMGDFQRTLNQYLAISSRELPKALNSKMFFIARGASRLSPKANRADIERQLGVTGYKVKIGKKGKPLMRNGKPRWDRQFTSDSTVANLVINARLGRAGKPGLYGWRMKQAVSEMVNKRVRSIGTIKAGWLNAIRKFGAAVGEASFKELSAWRLRGGSRARVAKSGFTPVAELEYLVNSFTAEHQQYIDGRTKAALAQAYSDEMRSMEKYIIEKMQKQADKLSKP
jgi:hypothetical protein